MQPIICIPENTIFNASYSLLNPTYYFIYAAYIF